MLKRLHESSSVTNRLKSVHIQPLYFLYSFRKTLQYIENSKNARETYYKTLLQMSLVIIT